jgi:hypothetical protein
MREKGHRKEATRCEVLSFGASEGRRNEHFQKKIIVSFRSWEHAHTHTQGLIIVQDLH